jgi:excisionase family DNA binding protein
MSGVGNAGTGRRVGVTKEKLDLRRGAADSGGGRQGAAKRGRDRRQVVEASSAAAMPKRGIAEATLEELLTIQELADYWRVGVRTLRDWIRNQGLPSRKIGTLRRFSRSEVDAWAAQPHGIGTSTPGGASPWPPATQPTRERRRAK